MPEPLNRFMHQCRPGEDVLFVRPVAGGNGIVDHCDPNHRRLPIRRAADVTIRSMRVI